MGEDLDYMSDEFIKNCADNANDVRPGLLKTHNAQRQHNLMKKKNLELDNKKKSSSVLQLEILEESLKQPISAMNKGFSMLEKMGFRSGMGLGKNNSGIKEPIGINIKNDKVGLGHRTANKTNLEKKDNKLDKINEDDYRAFLSKKNKQREVLGDLRKSQRICKELDSKADRNVPLESWFWPDEEILDSESERLESTEDDDDDKKVELSDVDKLEMLTKYLRNNYFYCIWCKVQYDDEKDMKDCPGLSRDDH